jgi:CRP/FNR family transcriptional regulator
MTINEEYWSKYFPAFANSSDRMVENLMSNAALVEIPKNKQVFYPGSICENYLLVLKGCVKTQLISENGREVALYYVRSGDSCVLTTSCLLGGDSYPVEGVTEEKTTAFAISAKNFQNCLNNSIFFRQFVFKNFAERLSSVMSRMEEVVFESIDQRLCKYLLDCNQSLITHTHQELAMDLGSAREVVSRHLKRYERSGWVKLSRGSVKILDTEALRAVAYAVR